MIDLLTKRDLARACKVSPRTIENWMANGDIPYLKIGRNVRFQLPRVETALRAFEVPPKREEDISWA